MRKLFWLLLAVAVLLLGAPLVVGLMAEREAYKQIELLQDNPMVALKISNYDRGWFKSDVIYEYGLKDEYIDLLVQSSSGSDTDTKPENDPNWLEITAPLELLSQITHGPIIFESGLFIGLFRAETTTGPDNPRLNEFLKATNMPYLFVAKNTTGFSGTTDFTVEVPPIDADTDNLPPETELRDVEFSGMKIAGRYDAGSENIASKGGAEHLNIVADNLSLTLQGLEMNADTSIKIKSLPMGSVTLTMKQMAMFDATADQPERLELNGLSITTDTQATGNAETANATATYLLAEAKLGEDVVTDLEVTVLMSELSIAAAESYSKWSEDFLSIDSEDPEAAEELVANLNVVVHQFLQTSPTLGIKPLKFTANGEPFESDFNISVDGSKLPAVGDFELSNIPMWMGMISGGAGATISETLANTLAISIARGQLSDALGEQEGITEEQIDEMAAGQAPVIIETLMQQGVITRENDTLTAKFSYKDAEMLLNGNPVPIDALLGSL